MKKLIFIPVVLLVLLILNLLIIPCFAQTSDKDIQTLSNDILKLRQENYRLKTNFTGSINELKKSIDASSNLFIGVESNIKSINDSLAKTNSLVSKMQEETNTDFVTYKTYFIIVFVFFLILIAVLTYIILTLLSKLNKEQTNLFNKLTEFKDSLNKQIISTSETLNTRMDENFKSFENQIKQTSTKLEKEISQAKQTSVDQLSKLKSDFDILIDEIQKTIKNHFGTV